MGIAGWKGKNLGGGSVCVFAVEGQNGDNAIFPFSLRQPSAAMVWTATETNKSKRNAAVNVYPFSFPCIPGELCVCSSKLEFSYGKYEPSSKL